MSPVLRELNLNRGEKKPNLEPVRTKTEQTVVRSLRDISIVYSVGEMLSNTVEHFDESAELSGSGSEVSGDPSGSAPSQPRLGLPGTGNGFRAMDVGREDE